MPGLHSDDLMVQALALFLLTFVHEDAAILAAAYARIEAGLPLGLAFGSVLTGVLAGDLAIYGLGRAARRSAWLRARLIGPGVDQARRLLERHMVRLIFLCRVVPGMLSPTFLACGWFGLPLRRFALVSLASALAYTPLAMGAALWLGATVLHRIGRWSWLATLALSLVLLLTAGRRSWPGRRARSGKDGHKLGLESRSLHQTRQRHYQGMPKLLRVNRGVAVSEHIPVALFYLPLLLHWLVLALRYRSLTLPTVANPMIETGGFWGESKVACMDQVGPEQRCWVADYQCLDRSDDSVAQSLDKALDLAYRARLGFPLVAKPDIGWQGYGVRLLAEPEQLKHYLEEFPRGERLLLQRQVPFDGEAGVFYARLPGEPEGRVFSLTLRYFPSVVGDGHSSMRELVVSEPKAGWKARYHLGRHREHSGLGAAELERVPPAGELVRLAFIGSLRVGGLYRDARGLITPELSRRFDAIARSMPEFYFGRFDIRFESTELLQLGEGFSIIEINGAGSEAIHVWDPELPLRDVYRELFATQDLMFDIAARNRARGYRPIGLFKFLKSALRQQRLIRSYPPSG
ncbi:MAG: VTT domain-containing protein [Burkholderiales bacterium]|nr:VTT domain-containing protein [Burkholderiales bacterium]